MQGIHTTSFGLSGSFFSSFVGGVMNSSKSCLVSWYFSLSYIKFHLISLSNEFTLTDVHLFLSDRLVSSAACFPMLVMCSHEVVLVYLTDCIKYAFLIVKVVNCPRI